MADHEAIVLDVDLIVSQHQREPHHDFQAIMLELGQQQQVDAIVETVTVEEMKVYFQRALDSGTGGYVYWTSVGIPDPTPTPSETTPNFTGMLSVYTIVRVLGCDN